MEFRVILKTICLCKQENNRNDKRLKRSLLPWEGYRQGIRIAQATAAFYQAGGLNRADGWRRHRAIHSRDVLEAALRGLSKEHVGV